MFKATWQRCRVRFLRNALAYANKGQRHMVFALINTIFAQDTNEAAHAQCLLLSWHDLTGYHHVDMTVVNDNSRIRFAADAHYIVRKNETADF